MPALPVALAYHFLNVAIARKAVSIGDEEADIPAEISVVVFVAWGVVLDASRCDEPALDRGPLS
jgi:hypothetical protein